MKPRTLGIDTPIMDLRREIVHTLAMTQAYPFLGPQVALMEPFIPAWQDLLHAELALDLDLQRAEVRIIVVDERLDSACIAIEATLRVDCGNDREHPEYQRYFKNIRLSDLRRPVLGSQLVTMSTWSPSLQTSASATLREYGNGLAAIVNDAEAEVAARSEVERKIDDSRVRARKPFIDRLNAARHALFGQLSEMVHKHPERKLNAAWVQRFFLRGNNSRRQSAADLERDVLRMRTRLAQKEQRLADLLAEQEREQRLREDAEYAEAMQALAEAEKLQAEAEARVEALQARLRERTGDTGTPPAGKPKPPKK